MAFKRKFQLQETTRIKQDILVVTALSPLLILTVISGAGALLGVVMTRRGMGRRGGNVQSAQGAAYSICKLAWRSIQAISNEGKPTP